jgi:TatD DNase family protein
LADSELAVAFAQKHEGVWASIGIHPHEAKDHLGADTQARFAALASLPKVVAVGECGLDYFYGHSPKEDQAAVLRFQIELALEQGLPLSFHVREAFDDFWPIFESYQGVRGVLHSFTDSQENMERAVAHGLYIGVNGIATFTRDEAQIVTYRTIPQHSLLLETDAPFLTPKPFRGKVCEPKHLVQTAEFLAVLRGESVEHLAESTTANAQKLLNLT